MKSALKIFKDISVHDFQMSGHFGNELAGVPIVPDDAILPFFTTKTSAVALTVAGFKLQQLGAGGVVVTEYTLTDSWITTTQLSTYLFLYQYKADVNILETLTNYTSGIYRFAFTLGASQYYSDTFELNDFRTIGTVGAGDFEIEDLNEDFF